MTTLDLDLLFQPVTTTATTSTARSTATPTARLLADFGVVTAAWAVVVIASTVFPFQESRVSQAALFIHLVGMAIGFGSVVMIDVFGLMWLFGYKTLYELVDLVTVAHGVIAVGVGALLASGIALHPDMSSPLARLKMLLVLVLMLNGVWAQRLLQGMKRTLPADVRGANIPWAGFQKALAAALISQSTWWGSIAIGFLTNAARHS
jgi:hypothetical protein